MSLRSQAFTSQRCYRHSSSRQRPRILQIISELRLNLLRSLEKMETGKRPIRRVSRTWKVNVLILLTHGFQLKLPLNTEICHHLLDLLIHAAQNPSATTSPSTPSSPSPHAYASPRTPHPSNPLLPHQTQSAPPPPPFKHDTLMRLKIYLRETEHPARPRDSKSNSGSSTPLAYGVGVAGTSADDVLSRNGSVDTAGLGKNEGTVRFVFGPERLVGAV